MSGLVGVLLGDALVVESDARVERRMHVGSLDDGIAESFEVYVFADFVQN